MQPKVRNKTQYGYVPAVCFVQNKLEIAKDYLSCSTQQSLGKKNKKAGTYHIFKF